MKSIRFVIAALIVPVLGCATANHAQVNNQAIADIAVPVTFQMPFAGSTVSSNDLTLESTKDGVQYPAQISVANQQLNKGWVFASAVVPFSQIDTGTWILRQTNEPLLKTSSLQWKDDGQTTLSLFEGKRLILKYHYGVVPPPAGVPSHRARSSYFHPILGLDGETLTQDYPDDHHHHRGMYFAWPGVFVDGQRFDMWHIVGMWTKFERILAEEQGPVFATLVLQNGWYAKDRKVMDEIMELVVWHADETGQAIDLKYTWTPLEPIQIGPKDQKGYGGFNFRFPERKDTKVITIEGLQKGDSDLKRSPWVDFSGRFENQEIYSGISFMNHPENIDPNPGWTLRTSDGYGYIGISWPGLNKFDFVPGNRYTNQYRLWIHRGNQEECHATDAFEAYKKTPSINVGRAR